MKKVIVFFLSVAMAGCATSYQDKPLASASMKSEETRMSGMSQRFISLGQILPGMPRKDVERILGNQVVVGYELVDAQSGQYKPVTVKNPYRTEQIAKGSVTLAVDYYLLGINKSDGQVSDDELVPLVYQDDQLVGTGWMFLNEKIKKN